MTQHERISAECVDALVCWCFHCLPAMDGAELRNFLGGVLKIMERECREAVEGEREQWLTRLKNSSSQ
jgi:hypothetical protein